MKKSNLFLSLMCAGMFGLLICAGMAEAQTYKTAADTVKLNKEYAELKADIADLNSKLDKDNGKTAAYQQKVTSTDDAAVTAAQASKQQAATATDGNIKDVKKEEKKAEKANDKANDARDAKNDEKDNQKDIKNINSQIAKKQKRMNDLDEQRKAIMSQPATPASN